jgi:hypothetical protein
MHGHLWSGFIVNALLPFVLIVGAAAPTAVATSYQEKRKCPEIIIKCPADIGEPYIVSVKVEGADNPKKLTYNWSADNGEIISGQGTTWIQVRQILSFKTTRVTIKVGGLEGKCPNTTWCSFSIQH